MSSELDDALQIVAEAYRDNKIKDLRKSLIIAIKKAYGVEDLIFWKDHAGWSYCDKQKRQSVSWGFTKSEELDTILYLLPSLKENRGTIFYGKTRYESLDELKHDILTMELAGIENE